MEATVETVLRVQANQSQYNTNTTLKSLPNPESSELANILNRMKIIEENENKVLNSLPKRADRPTIILNNLKEKNNCVHDKSNLVYDSVITIEPLRPVRLL